MLRQLNYFDSDHEFLKRYYRHDEVPQRIQLLYEIHHPKQNWPIEVPTVASNIGRKHMVKFLKRHKKLCRKLAELDDGQNQQFSSDFLSTLRRQFHSQTDDERDGKSYDSSLHDIFGEYEEQPLPKELLQTLSSLQKGFISRGGQQGEWGTADGPSQLTLDFDDVDQAIVTQQYEKIKKKKMIKDVDSKSVTGNRQPLSSQLNDFDKATASKSHIATVHNKNSNPASAGAKPQIANLRDFGRNVTEQPVPQFYSPRLNELSKYSKRIFEKGKQQNREHYYNSEVDYESTRQYRQLASVKSSDSKFGFSTLLQNTPSRKAEINEKMRHEPIMNFNRQTSGQSSQLSTRQMLSQNNIEPSLMHHVSHGHSISTHSPIFQQHPPVNQPLPAKNPPSIENSQTARHNDFDQLRKRALELLNGQRNYPSMKRVGSPRYELYKR